MKSLLITFFLVSVVLAAQAQTKNEKVVKIKTSAVCSMCKETIEKDMAFEKGVKDSDLDLETLVLTVTYNPKKTDPETIRKRITKVGYDADSLKRDKEAFLKLPDCCQRPDPHHDNK